ncbi:MAG: 2'-5' RNA ligase family protein [Nanoarchaeota archaeon]
MLYLAYIKPCNSLVAILGNFDLKYPSSGLHLNLWNFNTYEKDEDHLINRLMEIGLNPFNVRTDKIKSFDNSSLVIKLEADETLCHLHNKIINAVRDFDKNSVLFDKMVRQYGGKNYNPHITISKKYVPGQIQEEIEWQIKGIEWKVDSFYLIKYQQEEKIWKDVKTFCRQS